MTTIETSTRWTSASVAKSAGGIAPTQHAKPTRRWSGDEDTFDSRWSDEPGRRWTGADHDDRAMTLEEQESRKWYEKHAENDWVDNDMVDEPRHKCRGGEEPIEYYRDGKDDDDDDHDDDNDDDDENTIQHVPYMNLTPDERSNMSVNFKFGMCTHCDAGLDDESEFVCESRWQSTVLVCNACHNYYRRLAYLRVVDDLSCGGCN